MADLNSYLPSNMILILDTSGEPWLASSLEELKDCCLECVLWIGDDASELNSFINLALCPHCHGGLRYIFHGNGDQDCLGKCQHCSNGWKPQDNSLDLKVIPGPRPNSGSVTFNKDALFKIPISKLIK